MKNLILVLLVIAFTGSLMASTVPAAVPATVYASAKSLVVEKTKWKSSSVNVHITDLEGISIVNENIKGTTRFNLKRIPDGLYRMELSDNQKITIQDFNIVGSAVILKEVIATYYKPTFVPADGKLGINIMAQGEKASISIYNAAHEPLLQEDIAQQTAITRQYNLKSLEAGNYYVNVKIGDRVYSHSFSK